MRDVQIAMPVESSPESHQFFAIAPLGRWRLKLEWRPTRVASGSAVNKPPLLCARVISGIPAGMRRGPAARADVSPAEHRERAKDTEARIEAQRRAKVESEAAQREAARRRAAELYAARQAAKSEDEERERCERMAAEARGRKLWLDRERHRLSDEKKRREMLSAERRGVLGWQLRGARDAAVAKEHGAPAHNTSDRRSHPKSAPTTPETVDPITVRVCSDRCAVPRTRRAPPPSVHGQAPGSTGSCGAFPCTHRRYRISDWRGLTAPDGRAGATRLGEGSGAHCPCCCAESDH